MLKKWGKVLKVESQWGKVLKVESVFWVHHFPSHFADCSKVNTKLIQASHPVLYSLSSAVSGIMWSQCYNKPCQIAIVGVFCPIIILAKSICFLCVSFTFFLFFISATTKKYQFKIIHSKCTKANGSKMSLTHPMEAFCWFTINCQLHKPRNNLTMWIKYNWPLL